MKKSCFWGSYLVCSLLLLTACQSETQEQQPGDSAKAAQERTAVEPSESKKDFSHWAGDYRPMEPVEGQGKKIGIRAIERGVFMEIVLVNQQKGCNKRLKIETSVSEEDVAITEGECPMEIRYKDGIIEIQEIEACFPGKEEACTFSGHYKQL